MPFSKREIILWEEVSKQLRNTIGELENETKDLNEVEVMSERKKSVYKEPVTYSIACFVASLIIYALGIYQVSFMFQVSVSTVASLVLGICIFFSNRED